MRRILTLLIIFAAAGSAGAQEKSWIGKTVIVKKFGIKISDIGGDGKRTDVGTLDVMSYTVSAEKDGWLQIKTHQGTSGWFEKDDAVVLDEAVPFFTQRIRANANDVDAYQYRSWAHQLKGDLDSALKDISEALRLNPLATHYHSRGLIHAAKKDLDKAIEDYNEALRLDPKLGGVHYNRATAWNAKQDYAKAIDDFSEAIRLDSKDSEAYWGRANARNSRKEFAKAAADYGEALKLDAKNADILSNLAWLLATCPDQEVRDGKRAVALANQAVKINEKGVFHLAALAAAYAETGNFAEAVRVQERVLKLDNSEFYRFVTDLYRKSEPYRQD